jgi:hypothetical protein
MALAETGDSGTSWGRVELGEGRRLGKLPRKGMLTPAGANQENAHRASLVPS